MLQDLATDVALNSKTCTSIGIQIVIFAGRRCIQIIWILSSLRSFPDVVSREKVGQDTSFDENTTRTPSLVFLRVSCLCQTNDAFSVIITIERPIGFIICILGTTFTEPHSDVALFLRQQWHRRPNECVYTCIHMLP